MRRRCSAISAPTSSRSSRRRATPRATPARASAATWPRCSWASNRNKRSIVLDLKTAPAREALLRLVDRGRCVRAQHPAAEARAARARLRRAADAQSAADLRRHPRLARGRPYSGRPAYDDIIQGLCGVASLMDQLTGEPRYAPTILCDKTSGLVAAQAILAALYSREKTGRGQFSRNPDVRDHGGLHHGRASARPGLRAGRGASGYARVLAPWRRPYRTADGYLCMLAYTDAQWRRFWAEVGKPEMMDGSALRRHGGAEPQHRRGLSPGRRAAPEPQDRGLDRVVRQRWKSRPGR